MLMAVAGLWAWPALAYGAPSTTVSPLTHSPLLLLSDTDTEFAIAFSRVLVIFVILLLCVLVIVFFAVLQLTRESAARVAVSESRFRTIFEGAPEAIIIVDPVTRQILAGNPIASGWLGYSTHEFEGMHVEQLLAREPLSPNEQFDFTFGLGSTFTREFQYQRKDGTLLDVEITGTHISFHNQECLLVFMRDITQRKVAERELQYRLHLDKIITSLSTSFINCATDEVDVEITRALRQIGEFVGVDRCYVYLISDDGQTLTNTHEWCADGIAPQIGLTPHTPVDRFPWWMARLRRFEHIHLPRVWALPEEATAERDTLATLGVQSCLAVPIISHLTLVGYLGFVSIRQEKSWPDDVIRLLRIVGEIFINTLIRTRAELEIHGLNADLRRRVNELNAANHELEAFSYSVSHDLRGPLRSIDGFSHMLWEDYYEVLEAQGKEYIDFIRTSSRRMAEIIDDLLNLAHVTRSEMQRERVNLSHVVQEISAELQKKEPNRRVEFSIPPNLAAQGDPRLLRLALENLLGNAWKFTGTREEARIEFGATEHEGRQAYFIRDNGVGFDPMRAGRLFRAFQRLHANTQFPGTGIGLAIVQRIVDRHGGAVWAESAVEKGATFYFTLSS